MKNKKAKEGMGIIFVILILLGASYYFFLIDNGIHNPFKHGINRCWNGNTCQEWEEW